MDYSKIDAKLSEVMEENLADPGLAIVVFIRLVDSLTLDQLAEFKEWAEKHNQTLKPQFQSLGLGGIFSATLLAHTIEELSNKSWVRSLKLSGVKKPLSPQEDELRQLFENNSNCYADTLDDSVVMAMSADKFVEVVSKLLTSTAVQPSQVIVGDGPALKRQPINKRQ